MIKGQAEHSGLCPDIRAVLFTFRIEIFATLGFKNLRKFEIPSPIKGCCQIACRGFLNATLYEILSISSPYKIFFKSSLE